MMQEHAEKNSSDEAVLSPKSVEPLWDKVRQVSAMIAALREENRVLGERLGESEQLMLSVKNQLLLKEMEVEQLRSDLQKAETARPVNGSDSAFQPDEAERLKEQIRSAIRVIDTYLGSS